LHPSVLEWVAAKTRDHNLQDLGVLECGSLNVNGSVRVFFNGPYHGIDMQDGPGVDQVISSWDIEFEEEFDVVVSTEMFEHDAYFWKSMVTMTRALKQGGYLLLTTRGIGFPFHEYPGDYWRFTEDAIAHLFDDAGLETIEIVPDPYPDHPGVFGLARKERR
jgi:SAM-dependent methyltransferase